MTPRGIRQNNPGNLRPGTIPWRGELAPIDNYCVFNTPRNGLRALALQLIIYQDRHSLTTIRGYINRWAPPADNNDTSAYVNAVCADVGATPDEPYNLHDFVLLAMLVEAIVRHENGQQPYTDNQIVQGVLDAYKSLRPWRHGPPYFVESAKSSHCA